MNTNHLSEWELDDYLLSGQPPSAVRHLAECAQCREAVERMEQTIGVFRAAAVEYSAQSLATRPQTSPVAAHRVPAGALTWAFAALLPLLLLWFALLPYHATSSKQVKSDAAISDDALLDQVDEQLSVAVPSSMESLTHLVSTGDTGTGGRAVTPGMRSKSLVQSN